MVGDDIHIFGFKARHFHLAVVGFIVNGFDELARICRLALLVAVHQPLVFLAAQPGVTLGVPSKLYGFSPLFGFCTQIVRIRTTGHGNRPNGAVVVTLEHTVLVVANGTYNITLANIHRGTPCAPIVNGDGIAVAERAVKRLGHAGGIVGRIYRTILEGSIRT